jgi:hypothetical protein
MESLDIMGFLDAVQPSGIAQAGGETKTSIATAGKMPALQTPLQAFLADVIDQVTNATGVTPLVVVPRNYLDQGSTHHESHGRIHNRRA